MGEEREGEDKRSTKGHCRWMDVFNMCVCVRCVMCIHARVCVNMCGNMCVSVSVCLCVHECAHTKCACELVLCVCACGMGVLPNGCRRGVRKSKRHRSA